MDKKDWYFLLCGLVVFVMIGINELNIGLGIFAYALLMPLVIWLGNRAFKQD